MSALLALAVAILAAQPSTPDAVYKVAALDLVRGVPPERRRTTRYLSLHAVPEADRPKFMQSLAMAINSVSFRRNFARPLPVEGGLLLRVDLEALGWDRDSRTARRARLEQAGVKFAFKDKAEEARFLDPWEDFAAKDPYFKVTQTRADGSIARGWIDPTVEAATRALSRSSSFILRADWLLPRLLTEKDQGGFYSALLMLPPNEGDLYKVLYSGGDVRLKERDPQLKQGGATLGPSIVAHHDRALEILPSDFGYDEKFIWRTYDFAQDSLAGKNVLEVFRGEVKHDGREVIFSLPNGLHGYVLFDGKGKQVAVVPPNIALDMRPDGTGLIRDRNVINSYKCIDCHGQLNGIQPYDDIVSKMILTPGIGLAIISKDPKRIAELKQATEDYYLDTGDEAALVRASTLAATARQQDSYAARIKALNGLESDVNADLLTGWFNKYVWDLVELDQAAREMGLTREAAVAQLRASGNPQLIVLSAGQPIRRAAFERAFADAMRAATYSWERN